MAKFDEFELECVRQGMRPFSDVEWFATDSAGNLAAFVTAGLGPVPLCVFEQELSLIGLHTRVDALPAISTTEPVDRAQGTNPSFVRLAAKGFFVYDWNHARGRYCANLPYRLTTRPRSPLKISGSTFNGLLPELTVRFSDATGIVVEDLFTNLNL